jgi:hypothetical protein
MDTFPLIRSSTVPPYAFEIENAYVSARRVARILDSISGVANIRVKKPFHRSEYRVEFDYNQRKFVVWEPFGDNSRFWIGPKDSAALDVDISRIEEAFLAHRPSIVMQLVGNALSLHPFRRRSSTRHPSVRLT